MWCRNKGRRIKKKTITSAVRPSNCAATCIYVLCVWWLVLCSVCFLSIAFCGHPTFHFNSGPYCMVRFPAKKCLQCLFVLLLLIRGFCFCFFLFFFEREFSWLFYGEIVVWWEPSDLIFFDEQVGVAALAAFVAVSANCRRHRSAGPAVAGQQTRRSRADR